METKIRKRVLTVIGGLLIAALTIQMATAAARNARKAARAPVLVAQHFRHAFGSGDWTSTAPSDYSNYNKRHGLSAPAAVANKSCDRLWCYEN
jgi:hypothetical protein